MGNWNLNIQGIACHHNTNHAGDAEKLAKAFVEKLREAGQLVETATFTSGSKEDLKADAPSRPPLPC